MASLVLSSDTVKVNLLSERLEVIRHIRQGENERLESSQIRIRDIDRLVIIGAPAISMPALTHLIDCGIPCSFLTRYGRWRGGIQSGTELRTDRRRRQYAQEKDGVFSLRVSQALIGAKIRNSRRVLQRLAANRNAGSDSGHIRAMETLRSFAGIAQNAKTIEKIRGTEGIAASLYFERLGRYFPPALPFPKRSRRPPRDSANALLSFGYAILLGEIEGAVRAHGLDAGAGHLHTDRINRPSLALDLMEPLRAPVIDLLALDIANHAWIDPKTGFEPSGEDGGVYLSAEGRKAFFHVYEQAMNRPFSPAPGAPATTLRRIIDAQVCSYLGMLEEDREDAFFKMP